MHEILTVARKEFLEGVRNRWLIGIVIILALFALGLGYLGTAVSGKAGLLPLDTLIVSLASLAVFLLPLIALLLGYDTIIGERENGTLLLLLSYPLSRSQLISGKFLGHLLVLTLATVLGFGVAAASIAALSGNLVDPALWRLFGAFIFSSVLLGGVFLALAYLISVTVSEKTHAVALALGLWFFFVLAYDLGLLGLLVLSHGAIGRDLFPYLLLLNPNDVFRLANFTLVGASTAYPGMAPIVMQGGFSLPLLLSTLLGWLVLPFLLALWRFQRAEL